MNPNPTRQSPPCDLMSALTRPTTRSKTIARLPETEAPTRPPTATTQATRRRTCYSTPKPKRSPDDAKNSTDIQPLTSSPTRPPQASHPDLARYPSAPSDPATSTLATRTTTVTSIGHLDPGPSLSPLSPRSPKRSKRKSKRESGIEFSLEDQEKFSTQLGLEPGSPTAPDDRQATLTTDPGIPNANLPTKYRKFQNFIDIMEYEEEYLQLKND